MAHRSSPSSQSCVSVGGTHSVMRFGGKGRIAQRISTGCATSGIIAEHKNRNTRDFTGFLSSSRTGGGSAGETVAPEDSAKVPEGPKTRTQQKTPPSSSQRAALWADVMKNDEWCGCDADIWTPRLLNTRSRCQRA